MSRGLPFCFVAIALGYLGIGASAAKKLSTFSRLPATDTLQVRFISGGCFHSTTHEFTFRRGTPSTVAVVSVQPECSDAKQNYFDKSRGELGQVPLSDSDLKGLDELLRFYQSKPRGGCTTSDTITISQIRNGKPIATETFIDSSCSTYNLKGVTTFPEIVRRLEKGKR